MDDDLNITDALRIAKEPVADASSNFWSNMGEGLKSAADKTLNYLRTTNARQSWEDLGNVAGHAAQSFVDDPVKFMVENSPTYTIATSGPQLLAANQKINELKQFGQHAEAAKIAGMLPLIAMGMIPGIGSEEKAAVKVGEEAAVSKALKIANETKSEAVPIANEAKVEAAPAIAMTMLPARKATETTIADVAKRDMPSNNANIITNPSARELIYDTEQSGPFYRVSPRQASKNPRIVGGDENKIWTPSPADVRRIAGDRGHPPYGTTIYDSATGKETLVMPSEGENMPLNVANEYVKTLGLPAISQPEMPVSSLAKQAAIGRVYSLAVEGSPQYKTEIFEAYKRMMPDVVKQANAKNYDELMEAAYRQMGKETSDQFDRLPLNYSFHRAGEGNYANSGQMVADVHGNNHLFVYQGGDKHDFLHNIDPKTGLNENEKFRAVHDAFGHALLGNTFGAQGEERAWGLHSQMYSPLARLAMTSETRGQNSFVNYTPANVQIYENLFKLDEQIKIAKKYGTKEDVQKLKDQRKSLLDNDWQYAPNKAVLMPPEFLSTSYTGEMPNYIKPLIQPKEGTQFETSLTHYSMSPNLSRTDPAMYGTNTRVRGEEKNRLDPDVRDRTYFYLGEPGSQKNIEGDLGPYRYGAYGKNIYNVSEDPENLARLAAILNTPSPLATMNPGAFQKDLYANDLDRLIKMYGYSGRANTTGSYPQATIFNPVSVNRRADGGRVGYATLGAVQEDNDSDITDALRLAKTSAPTGDPSADAMQRVLLSGAVSPQPKPYDLGRQIQEGIQAAKDLYGSYKGNVTEANRSAADLQSLAVENMRSGSPGRMLLGAGQDILAPVAGVMAPLTGGLETARQGVEYRLGAGPANAFEVAANIAQGPEDIVNAARMAAKSAPTVARAAEIAPAMEMTTLPARKATETAIAEIPNKATEAAVIEAAKRELTPLGFYSRGAEAAKEIPQAKGSTEQMVGMLRKQPGVSEHELINAGILTDEGKLHPEFASRGTISREDLASHLQSSMPQVEETVLGVAPKAIPYPEEYQKVEQSIIDKYKPEFEKLDNGVVEGLRSKSDIQNDLDIAGKNFNENITNNRNFDFTGEGKSMIEKLRSLQKERDDHTRAVVKKRNDLQENMFAEIDRALPDREEHLAKAKLEAVPTKYGEYALPGGENYREVLLRLPQSSEYVVRNKNDQIISRHPDRASALAEMQKQKVNDPYVNIDKASDIEGFHSQHWDDPNILAHIRMADRTGPNGEKILHVEEVQSDWGQKGKKEGFSNPNAEKEYQAYIDDMRKRVREKSLSETINAGLDEERAKNLIDKMIPTMKPHELANYLEERDNLHAAYDKYKKETQGLPSAPYVTSTSGWTDLALKRILKEAAEGGYDKVVWTPGAEQAGRYDLSEYIDQLEYHPETTDLIGIRDGQSVFHKSVEPHEIENYVGKDVAKNLLSQPIQGKEYSVDGFHSLSGQDLAVGGKGMKEYYDDILPKRLQKLANKHDKTAKVAYTDILLPPSGRNGSNDPPISAPGLDITPQMRESILRGQGAYKKGGRVGYATNGAVQYDSIELPNSLKELQNWAKTHPAKLTRNSMDNVFTNRISALEGEKPIAMPANLRELQDWDRISHDHALNLARKLYDSED